MSRSPHTRTLHLAPGGPRARLLAKQLGPLRAAAAVGAILALAGFGGQRVLAHRASIGQVGPQCVPSQLDRSALLPGTTLTVSPLPDSYDASPLTQISLLGSAASAIAGISVQGSVTGLHSGRLIAYSQGDGASFLPRQPFAAGETVTVHGHERRGAAVSHFAFRFTIAQPDPLARPRSTPKPKGKPGDISSFRSQPSLHAPTVSITASAPQAAPGYVFATPYSGPGQDGPMIFDNAGNLVWLDPVGENTKASNLQVDQYEGKPVLSWWQGYIPPQGFGEGEELIADSSYRILFHVHAGNGYLVDLHDFRLQPNNTALLTVFDPIHCNLSAVSGPHDGAVTDGVLQEVDLRTRLVRREWHSLDHVGLYQSSSSPSASGTSWPFDFFHINSIERRQDGSYLVSARNTSAMYILNATTGQVALQIGGRHGSVQLGSGTPTAYQHDAQELPNGEISIFDNGGVPMVHSQSRGIVVALNLASHTETLVAQYEHPKPLRAGSQGNLQLLENGDFFIGWGSQPYFSEFTPTGALAFDAHLPHGTQSYRGYRFAWSAVPYWPPAIAAVAGRSGVTVYASWNGATGVASWRVLAGPDPNHLSALTSAARAGFETAIALPGAPAYVAVQALDGSGTVLGSSQAIKS